MRKICLICKEGFSTESKKRKYCSEECSKKGRREWRNEYDREMRKISKEIGNCSYCFRPKDNPKYKWCFKCRKKKREKKHLKRKKK